MIDGDMGLHMKFETSLINMLKFEILEDEEDGWFDLFLQSGNRTGKYLCNWLTGMLLSIISNSYSELFL
jgi:hypothetical protein